MCKRKRCRNKDCGVLFVPCRQVPGQEYCSRKECQPARKREWNRKKLATDPDYKEAGKRRRRDGKKKIHITGKSIVPAIRNTPGRIVVSKASGTWAE